jgi:hypothetical protein
MRPQTAGCALSLAAAVLAAPTPARADCPPGVEFCWDGGTMPCGGGAYGCWSDKEKNCNTPPEPCEPSSSKAFTFIDDLDARTTGS